MVCVGDKQMSQGCASELLPPDLLAAHKQGKLGFLRFGELGKKFDAAVARVLAVDQTVKIFRYYTQFLKDGMPPRFEVEESVEETNPEDIRAAFRPQPSGEFVPIPTTTFLANPMLDLDPKSLDDLVKLKAGLAKVVDCLEHFGISTLKAAADLDKCADNVQQALDCVLKLESLLKPSESVLQQRQKKLQELNAQLCDYCQPGDVTFRPLWCPDSLCLAGLATAANTALAGWLPGKHLRLLWRASRDGRMPQTFHGKCDNQGATLTVVRSVGGFVFGGFAPVAWTSGNVYMTTPSDAWLFTLTNPSGTTPTNFRVHNVAHAMYCKADYMPTFGAGHDLHVSGTAGTSHTNFPSTFTDTTGLGNALFTGSPNFEWDEVEVFAVP